MPELNNSIMAPWIGNVGNTTYLTSVISGAHNEDQQDIIYMNCGFNLNMFGINIVPCTMTTINHFWNADNGDNDPVTISVTDDNAFKKAEHLWYGTLNFFVGVSCANYGVVDKVDHSGLSNLYQNGNIKWIGYWNSIGQYFTKNIDQQYSVEYRRRISYDILGRICHLLADMSVPAHAHNDAHSPVSEEGTDNYEQWAKNNYSNYTWVDALSQGGTLFDVSEKKFPIRYLMYVLNEYADFFPSDGDWSGEYLGDREYTRAYFRDGIEDSYPILDNIFSQLNTPPSSVNNPIQASHLIPFAIRATASLLYLFAIETDIIPNTLFTNSFMGGKINLNNADSFSGYRRVVNNSSPVTLQAIDQVYDNCYWRFQNWQKIVNGTVVQTFTTRNITITPTANTTYKANFTSENYFFWNVTGSLKGLYRGESRVFKIYANYGNPPANYYWHTKYRSIYNGQVYWTDGLPDGCSISFISNGTNTATFTNNYFSKYCGGWADSVIRVYGTVQPGACGCSNQTFFEEITLKDRTRPGYPPPPPPPGGCPYVYTWNGNTWIEENNILPQSQDPTLLGQNVTDYYQLFTKPVEEDGKYYLAISEYEEDKSYFDQFKLLVIDHPEETFITIDDSGTVIQFAKPAFFANAQLDSNDVYKQLLSLDDIKTEVSESDVLSLSFEDVNSGNENWLLLVGQVEPIAKEKISGTMISKNNGGKENSATYSSFRLRRNPTYQWVLAPTSSSSTLQIDIAWQENAQVDYTELSNKLELPFVLNETEMLSATHSVLGDIKSELMASDGIFSEMNKNEWIELSFSIPPTIDGMQRSFVFISNGRYEHIIERSKYNVSGKNQLLKNNSGSSKPLEYRLEQNYPNPFNPASTINYSVKENGYVRLKVYDIIGNEVAELVNGNLTAGNYSVEFNAGELPSGVYIYSIQVNNFFDSKKMILIK